MIFAKDGDINIDGNVKEILQDWCILTDAIFKKAFSEKEYKEKLRDTTEFIIEQSQEFDRMKG